MSLDPLYVLLGEVSVYVFCPFFNCFFCLAGVELCEFFIYFRDQTLVGGYWELPSLNEETLIPHG